MRRLGDVTIEVGDRWQAPARKPKATPRAPSRQKIRRRSFPLISKRMRRLAVAVLLILGIAALPVWAFVTPSGKRTVAEVRADTLDISARAGLRVVDVYVEGRSKTPKDELVNALGVRAGDPILGLDLKAARQRIEEISWVRSATLERRLPGEIHLVITERAPIALWQNQGHYYLVDRSGLVIGDDQNDLPPLPLIVGEGAPDHAAQLLEMLAREPSIQSRVKAATWVSGRRWNLTLDATDGGLTVRLPEDGPAAALTELVRLDREQKILDRKISVIDMRLPDRLVLRRTPDPEPAIGNAHAHSQQPRNGAPKAKAQPGKDT